MKILLITLTSFLLASNIYSQIECDSSSSTDIFIASEIRPAANITAIDLENILNSSIDLTKYELPKELNVKVYFIISCDGTDSSYRVKNLDNKELEYSIVNVLKTNIEWTPAINQGRYVNFQNTLPLRIKDNRFDFGLGKNTKQDSESKATKKQHKKRNKKKKKPKNYK